MCPSRPPVPRARSNRACAAPLAPPSRRFEVDLTRKEATQAGGPAWVGSSGLWDAHGDSTPVAVVGLEGIERPGECVGVDQLVGVALLGQEPLAALRELGVVGVAR